MIKISALNIPSQYFIKISASIIPSPCSRNTPWCERLLNEPLILRKSQKLHFSKSQFSINLLRVTPASRTGQAHVLHFQSKNLSSEKKTVRGYSAMTSCRKQETCVFDISIQISSTNSRGFWEPYTTVFWREKSATIAVSNVHMIYGLISKAHQVAKYYDNNPNCWITWLPPTTPTFPKLATSASFLSRILLSLFLLVTHRSCCDKYPLTSFRVGLIRPNWATSVKANNLMYGRMEEEREIKAILFNLCQTLIEFWLWKLIVFFYLFCYVTMSKTWYFKFIHRLLAPKTYDNQSNPIHPTIPSDRHNSKWTKQA